MNTKKIKSKIIESGYTNIQIAEKVGINPQTISNWINGKNMNTTEQFLKMCIIINLDPREIIKR